MPGALGTYQTRPLRPATAPDGQPWAIQPGQAFNADD